MSNCLNPNVCYKCGMTTAKDGILSPRLVFSPRQAMDYFCRIAPNEHIANEMMESASMTVDCGKCINCLVRKRKAMSVRLQHECKMTDDVCFITLTYSDKHLPFTNDVEWKDKVSGRLMLERGSCAGVATLLPLDVQLFMKRLRRHLEYRPIKTPTVKRDHVDKPIRFFAVGEYGTKFKRPHYHIIIFGWKPSDLTFWKDCGRYQIYRSAQIEKLWRYGFSTVCDVNPATCKYCARYVTKKFVKSNLNSAVCPEFTLQSVRNGGMGAPWLDKYFLTLSNGFVNTFNRLEDGRFVVSKNTIPRYYYDRLRRVNKPYWLELRDMRIEFLAKRLVLNDEQSRERIEQSLREADCAFNDILHENEYCTF